MQDDERYFARRAEEELSLAAGTTDNAVKAIHLDMAARYATLRELAAAPHRTVEIIAMAVDEGSAKASPLQRIS